MLDSVYHGRRSRRGHTHTHTLSLSLSLSLTHTHTHSLSLYLSLSHTHTHTHTLSLSLTLTRTRTHTHTHTHAVSSDLLSGINRAVVHERIIKQMKAAHTSLHKELKITALTIQTAKMLMRVDMILTIFVLLF